MLKELNIFGIFVAPMALYVALGVAAFIVVRGVMTRFKLNRFIWHHSLFDVALFVSLVSLITILAISVVG